MIKARDRTALQNFFLILILGFLEAITPFSIDTYLPAFPQIAKQLHTDVKQVSLTISSYFIAFALGQILYGPLLDRFGRKRPLYTGLSVYIIASIGCSLSSSLQMLIVLRFVQALGGCVASVAAIAMVRDFFDAKKSTNVYSLLMLILGASPMFAPSIGSMIIAAASWQFVFIFLAVLATISLGVTIFFLPEGQKPDVSVSLKPLPILQNFWSIFRQPQFYVYVISGSFSFAGLFVYVAGSPDLFMNYFHLGAKNYSLVFALLSIGLIGGSQLNHLLIRKFKNEQIFKTAVTLQTVLSVLFFISAINNWCGLTATIIFLFLILLCIGLSIPTSTALALAPFSSNTGSASALLGLLRLGTGALISVSLGVLHLKGAVTMPLVLLLSSATGLLILLIAQKQLVSKPALYQAS